MKTHITFSIITTLFLLITYCGFNIAQADQIGRLFTTPKQRAVLNKLRANYDPAADYNSSNDNTLDISSTLNVSKQVKFNGYVLRNKGKNVIWLNGKPVSRQFTTTSGIRANPNRIRQGKVKLTVTNQGRSRRLKPGQTLDIDSSQVVEGYINNYSKMDANNNNKTICRSIRTSSDDKKIICRSQ